jgi:hypothetical protein
MVVDVNEAYNVIVQVTMCKQLAEYLDGLAWRSSEARRSMADLIRILAVDGLVARGYVTVTDDEVQDLPRLPKHDEKVDIADLGL